MRTTLSQYTIRTHFALCSIALLVILAPVLAAAQERNVDVAIDATTRAELTPLERLRANTRETREERQDMRAEVRTDIRTLQDTRMDTRQEMRADMQETRADTRIQLRSAETQDQRRATLESAREARQNMRELRVDARAEFRTALGTRVAQYKSAMMETLSNAIERMNDFLVRLESRIAKIAEKGGDTAAAELSLRAALAATAQAATDIEAADAKIVAIIDGDAEVSVKRSEIRTVVTEVAQSVRTAHAALKATLEEARKAAQSIEVSSATQVETDTAI